MILLLVELKLDVKAFFNADLHLDGLMLLHFFMDEILHDELLFLRDAIVLPVDADVDVVADAHVDSMVRLELLLHSIEREIVCHVVGQRARRLQVSNQLREDGVLFIVKLVLNYSNKLNTNALVIQFLVLQKVDGDLPLDILPILSLSIKERIELSCQIDDDFNLP